jgi:flagellar M-ring protein FliF
MEDLLSQLKNFSGRFTQMPMRNRVGMIVGGAVIAGLLVTISMMAQRTDNYEFVFTDLTPEDSNEVAMTLKSSGIPYRLQSDGSAVSVEKDRVYDARMLLAGAGLPRGGFVGFDLFDKGDLGVSQFTQKINLRRAIEGELARTISSMANIKTARVHLTMSETGLFKEDDHDATAAVVLNLIQGRAMDKRAVNGIRHLVASAVPGLKVTNVSIVDSSGTAYTDDESWASNDQAYKRKLERQYEQRITGLLQPAVGEGAVFARVTLEVDSSDVVTTSEEYDPESAVVRSERAVNKTDNKTITPPGGVAGAAGNQPMGRFATIGATTTNDALEQADEVRNYEISKKVTTVRKRAPRVVKLSAAVLVDGLAGKARTDAEVKKLEELAKSAIGFDEKRGDRFEIASHIFTQPEIIEEPKPLIEPWQIMLLALILAAGIAALVLYRRKKEIEAMETLPVAMLRPGKRVADIDAIISDENEMTRAEQEADEEERKRAAALPSADAVLRERARRLFEENPSRALYLIRGWLNQAATEEEIPTEEVA